MSSLRNQSRSEIEYLSRSEAKSVYCGNGTALCRVLGAYLMYVDTTDWSVSPRLMLDGYWEPWTTSALSRLVRRNMSCVNIGANVGYFTLFLADLVGSNGKVHSFEPNPRALELLQANVEINGMGAVEVHASAVSDHNGSSTLLVSDQCIGGGYVGTIDDFTSDGAVKHRNDLKSVQVPVVTLDDALPAGSRVDLLLIDAEGSEEKIWRGMQRVRSDNPGMVTILEYEYRRYHDPLGLIRMWNDACGSNGLETIDFQGDIVKADMEALSRGHTAVPGSTDCMLVIRA